MGVLEFFEYVLPSDWIITAVTLPFAVAGQYVDTFKIMGRHSNSHALVNAGFNIQTNQMKENVRESDSPSPSVTITSASLLFGNLSLGPFQAKNTAAFLQGKRLSLDVLTASLSILRDECVVSPPSIPDPNFVVGDPVYRQSAAVALYFKFFLGTLVEIFGASAIPSSYMSAVGHYERALSTSEQSWQNAPQSESPVGLPVHKIEAPLQASGEAKYTSDVPRPAETKFAAPVLTTKANALVTAIDTSKALSIAGVVGVVSAQDVISIGGNNQVPLSSYLVFASAATPTQCVGQIVALVVATSLSIAQRAASMVLVTYAGERPVLPTLQRSLQHKDPVPDYKHSLQVTKDKAFAADSKVEKDEKDTKTETTVTTHTGNLTHTGQKHFYMETQTALVIPQEGGAVTVWCGHQSLQQVKTQVAGVLGTTESKVVVNNTRMGGAFGGKAFLPAPVIVATAVAAAKLKIPVLCQFDR